MKNELGFYWFYGIILIVLCLLGGYALGHATGITYGYKLACKDFHSGSLRMELKEYPGGERCWVWKK